MWSVFDNKNSNQLPKYCYIKIVENMNFKSYKGNLILMGRYVCFTF